MENRFKFRGINEKNELVYGYISFYCKDGFYRGEFSFTDTAKIYSIVDSCNYKVYSRTIKQCTGLLDKNEKLIFEGDKLKITGKNLKTFIGFLLWNNKELCYEIYKDKEVSDNNYLYSFSLISKNNFVCEIIGNIYESNN